MNKGDILLIPFPFTDLSGSKLRPAVVLIETQNDGTLTFITTQTQWKEPTDIVLQPSVHNGIKKTSIIRLSKIATIDKGLAKGKLGELNFIEMNELNVNLKVLLQLQ